MIVDKNQFKWKLSHLKYVVCWNILLNSLTCTSTRYPTYFIAPKKMPGLVFALASSVWKLEKRSY